MKLIPTIVFGALTLGALALSPLSVAADPGVGIILGEPTGVSFKSSLAGRRAIDAAAAWSFEGEGFLHLHADMIFHNWNQSQVKVDSGSMGFYYGIGGRAVLRDDDPRIGVRIPLGASYLIEDSPLEIFVEVVPVLDLTPDTEFRLNGGIGIRYWLR